MNENILDETIRLINEEKQTLFEMANLNKLKTNLPVNIWIDEMGKARKVPHNDPRIKVQNNRSSKIQDDTFSVLISKEPKVLAGTCKLSNKYLEEVYNFIKKYYNELMDVWNLKMDIDQFKQILYDNGDYKF